MAHITIVEILLCVFIALMAVLAISSFGTSRRR
jgi:hypothetical protein